MIRIIQSKDVGGLLKRKAARLSAAEQTVRPILDAVRKRGDKALLEYARRFDGFSRPTVRIDAAELRAAEKRLEPAFRSAVEIASGNILSVPALAGLRAVTPSSPARFALACAWDKSSGRSMPWRRTCRRGVIRCPRPC